MAIFSYKAVNPQGKFTEGHLEALDSRAATFHLQTMGLIPVSIEEPAKRAARYKLPKIHLQGISRKDILFFTEELSTLVHAGLPLDRALSVTTELTAKPA